MIVNLWLWFTSNDPEDNLASWLRKKRIKALEERENLIRQTAYKLWEQDGKPENRSEYYWLEAIKKLNSETTFGLLLSKLLRLGYAIENPIKLWRKKRDRDKTIKEIEAKQQAEEYNQTIKEKAYLLWKADGKPEGKDSYYWKLATDKVKGKNIPTIYKPYYTIEKRFLEPINAWINKQALFSILGKIEKLAVVVAIVTFVSLENIRRNNEVFNAWQTITSAYGQSGSGGRIKALEFLNSRPLRFPWIGWTKKKDWYWDERNQECKFKRLWGVRWQREPLVGLEAPKKAFLSEINLCGATLVMANLQEADLEFANLQKANLWNANLQEAFLVRANLQKADLWNANLQKARLREANLQKASLSEANLQEVVLFEANLQEAVLEFANLQKAYLRKANLQEAVLFEANLQKAYLSEAENLTNEQIKLACFWERAIYKGKWDNKKQTYVAIEPDNTKFIEDLKKDSSSDPEEPIDCEYWKEKKSN